MSAARFKSTGSYFEKKSDLTKRVVQTKPKRARKRTVKIAVPVVLMRDLFCVTAVRYGVSDKGTFDIDDGFEGALSSHLEGDAEVTIEPVSSSGVTAWVCAHFSLSDDVDQPFSKAQEAAAVLQGRGIASFPEVTADGKGHYRLWIFFERPVNAETICRSFQKCIEGVSGVTVPVSPAPGESVPLPLQGETALLQRGVFINTVGKMIKDQRAVLEDVDKCPMDVLAGIIDEYGELPTDGADSEPAVQDTEQGDTGGERENASAMAEPLKPVKLEAPVKGEARKGTKRTLAPEKSRKTPIFTKSPKRRKEPVSVLAVPASVFLLSFGERAYALNTADVVSVLSVDEIESVPGSRPPLAGIVVPGSRAVPVLDGSVIGSSLNSNANPDDRVVVLRYENTLIGLIAGSVNGPFMPSVFADEAGDVSDGVLSFSDGRTPVPLLRVSSLLSSYAVSEQLSSDAESTVLIMEHDGFRFALMASVVRKIMVHDGSMKSTVSVSGGNASVFLLDSLLRNGRPAPIERGVGRRLVLLGSGDDPYAMCVRSVGGTAKIRHDGICTIHEDLIDASSPIRSVILCDDGLPAFLIDHQRLANII